MKNLHLDKVFLTFNSATAHILSGLVATPEVMTFQLVSFLFFSHFIFCFHFIRLYLVSFPCVFTPCLCLLSLSCDYLPCPNVPYLCLSLLCVYLHASRGSVLICHVHCIFFFFFLYTASCLPAFSFCISLWVYVIWPLPSACACENLFATQRPLLDFFFDFA